MTIRMLQAYNGLYVGQIVTLAGAEEARLIGLGFASADLDGPAEGTGMLTSAQVAALTAAPIPFASLPAAAGNTGVVIRVSDIGVGGSDWASDGTNWLPNNGFVVFKSYLGTNTTPVKRISLATSAYPLEARITIPANVIVSPRKMKLRHTVVLKHAGGTDVGWRTLIMLGTSSGTAYGNAGFLDYASTVATANAMTKIVTEFVLESSGRTSSSSLVNEGTVSSQTSTEQTASQDWNTSTMYLDIGFLGLNAGSVYDIVSVTLEAFS